MGHAPMNASLQPSVRARQVSAHVDWNVFGGGNSTVLEGSSMEHTQNPMTPAGGARRESTRSKQESAWTADLGLDIRGGKARGWSIFMAPEEKHAADMAMMKSEHAQQRRQTK